MLVDRDSLIKVRLFNFRFVLCMTHLFQTLLICAHLVTHRALQQKEMNNYINPAVKKFSHELSLMMWYFILNICSLILKFKVVMELFNLFKQKRCLTDESPMKHNLKTYVTIYASRCLQVGVQQVNIAVINIFQPS